MYGLRKISNTSQRTPTMPTFVWPLEVGAEVESPYQQGLQCLLYLKDSSENWNLLDGNYWIVLEFDESDVVSTDTNLCNIDKGKIVFLSENSHGMLKFFDHEKFDSETAYYWALNTDDKIHTIDKIVEPYWRLTWAVNLGSSELLWPRITGSAPAYWWAKYIGNRDIMVDRITEEDWAFEWILGNLGFEDKLKKQFSRSKKINSALSFRRDDSSIEELKDNYFRKLFRSNLPEKFNCSHVINY